MAVREKDRAGSPPGRAPPPGRLGGLLGRLVGRFCRGEAPAPQPATGFYTDTTVCIGCKACEVACKQWNQLPADGLAWTGNSYDNTGTLSAESWRHVKFVEQFPDDQASRRQPPEAPHPSQTDRKVSLSVLSPGADAPGSPTQSRWLMMSDVCKHCAAAPCHHACPTGAIISNEFANVYVQPDICNGCA